MQLAPFGYRSSRCIHAEEPIRATRFIATARASSERGIVLHAFTRALLNIVSSRHIMLQARRRVTGQFTTYQSYRRLADEQRREQTRARHDFERDRGRHTSGRERQQVRSQKAE